MDNLVLPQKYDYVGFTYKGEYFKGEVQKIEKKSKGYLMLIKLRNDNEYRSCYLEQCENLVNISLETDGVITLSKGNTYE